MENQCKGQSNSPLWLTGCLCICSEKEMPDANIILRCTERFGFEEDKCDGEHGREDELLITTASSFLALWEFACPCGSSSFETEVCGKLRHIVTSLKQDSLWFAGVQRLLCSRNQFVVYIGAKLLARVLLTSLPRSLSVIEQLVSSLSNDLCLVPPSISRLALFTVIQKLLQHSHSSIHPHLADQRRMAERVCVNTCKCSSVDCALVQRYLVDCLHTKWTDLLHKFLFSPFRSSVSVTSEQILCQQSAGILNNVPLASVTDEGKECAVKVTSYLRLWDCLIQFITASISSHSDDSLFRQHMLCQKWNETLSTIQALPVEAENMLLGIINSYFQCPSEGLTGHFGADQNEHRHKLACSVLHWASTNIDWDTISVYGDLHGFGGVLQSEPSHSLRSQSVDPRFSKVCLLVFKAAAILKNDSDWSTSAEASLQQIQTLTCDMGSSWLVEVFSAEDDHLTDVLLCCLELYLANEAATWIREWLNPHIIFESFAKSISCDHKVVVDLLISADNHFLSYFLRYLKLLVSDIAEQTGGVLPAVKELPVQGDKSKLLVVYSSSSESDSDGGSCEETRCHERLKFKSQDRDSVKTIDFEAILNLCQNVGSMISKLHTKGMFPFNPTPLLNLLAKL